MENPAKHNTKQILLRALQSNKEELPFSETVSEKCVEWVISSDNPSLSDSCHRAISPISGYQGISPHSR